MSTKLKNYLIWGVILILVISIFSTRKEMEGQAKAFDYTHFLSVVDKGEVKSVVIQQQVISGKTKDGEQFTSYMPVEDPTLITHLMDKGITVKGEPPAKPSMLVHFLISFPVEMSK